MVRRYVRKRTFATPDRVLIHLTSEALRPEERTQEGIAEATRSGRSTLTKWLDRLAKKGLVTRHRLRLAGHPLPKYGYHLTEPGWRTATALRKNLSSQMVTVRAPSVGPLTVRVSEVPFLASSRLDLTTTLASVRKGRIDLVRASRPLPYRGPLVWAGGARRIDQLFGREAEFRALDAWWASGSKALLVTGLAGIGKSSLVAAWVQGHGLGAPVFGVELHPPTTSAAILADLGSFMAGLGKPSLAAHLSQGVPLDLAFVGRLLERELADGFLVVLDNADQASRDVARLVGSLFSVLIRKGMVRVVLLGRRPPGWLPRVRGVASSRQVINVHGLDPGASEALLRSRGLGSGSSLIREIIRRTRGHPLLLHLAASAGPGRGSAVRRYLEEEMWGTLSVGDRAVLRAASVFRKPVTGRVLGIVARADRRTLEKLTERNLLEQTVAGGYLMHDLVREFVQAETSDATRRTLHALAAEALRRSAESDDKWEAVYHLMEAGKAAEAATFLDSEGAPLLDCVAAEEISTMVGQVTLHETESETYCVFAELLGDSLRIRGHVGPALFQYGHARRLSERSRRPERVPRILRKMAFLERCRNRYPKALGYLIEAQARVRDGRNPAEQAEVLREMALAEQAVGGLAAAARHLSEAVDLATDMSDRDSLSRSLLALGSLEELRGHRELGLDYELEGLRIAEQSGNLTEVARASIVVGTGLVGMGRTAESLAYYNKGLQLARLLGNLRLVAYATMDRSACLIDLGRFDEAGRDLLDAKGAFKILEEPETLALLKVYEGNRQMGMGHMTSAKRIWRLGFEDLRRQGSKIDLIRGLTDVGMLCLNRGERDEGATYLVEARGLVEGLGNLTLLSEIDAALDRIDTSAVSR